MTPHCKVKRRRLQTPLEETENLSISPNKMISTPVFIGAHVSMAGGIENAITNSINIGANAAAFFLKSQRKWASTPLAAKNVVKFKQFCVEHNINPLKYFLPHGSYLVNLAQADTVKSTQAYNCFLDDLKRCELLGIGKFNFHPGSYGSCNEEQGIKNIARCINEAIQETKYVKLVLENMAGHGFNLGNNFEQLAEIIRLVERKDRIGVCLDSCHLFAAGYDIRTKETYEKTMSEFAGILGLQFLSGWHLNDSKAELGEKKDLHANIGVGFIGLEAFRLIVNDPRNQEIPLILETPAESCDIWVSEIKLLKSLIGLSENDDYIKEMSAKLQLKGKKDRAIQHEKAQKKKKNIIPS